MGLLSKVGLDIDKPLGTSGGKEFSIKNPDILGFGLDAQGDLDALLGRTGEAAARKAQEIVQKYGDEAIDIINRNTGLSLQDIASGQTQSLDAIRAGGEQARQDLMRGVRGAQSALMSGQEQAIADMQSGFRGATGELMRGLSQEQALLGRAGEQFGDIAGLTSPALENLQRSGTAGGAAQIRSDILTDPNQQAMLDLVQERTGRQLSEAGLRRSGAGAQMSNEALLDYVRGEEALQNQRQQQLAGMGIGGRQALAGTFGAQAGAAGSGARDLSSLLTQQGLTTGQTRMAGGQNLANLLYGSGGQLAGMGTQQGQNLANVFTTGAQNRAGIYGQQSGQLTDALSTIMEGLIGGEYGAAQAREMGAQNALSGAGKFVGGLMSMSDGRLKKNVEHIGEYDGLAVYRWDWNDEGNKLGLYGSDVGHIAQELLDSHPHLVTKQDNGYYSIDYSTDETVDRG